MGEGETKPKNSQFQKKLVDGHDDNRHDMPTQQAV